MADDPKTRLIPDLPAGANRPDHERKGGAPLHKNPNCPCPPCSARRRTQETLYEPARGRTSVAPLDPDALDADLPDIRRPTIRTRITAWLAMKAEDPSLTNNEIARRIGISPKTLQAMLGRARKEGWLRFDDPISRLEHEIIPKALDNLNHFLDAQDKMVTIEVAKGAIFPQFKEAKGISEAPQTVLALKIELPESLALTPGAPISVIDITKGSGAIVGTPRFLNVLDEPQPTEKV